MERFINKYPVIASVRFLAAVFVVLWVSPTFTETEHSGVLILAHGGTAGWNAQIKETVKEAGITLPVEISFGMGMMSEEVNALQSAVDRLQEAGVTKILAIPLLVSSHSSVYRQYEYLLGLRKDPSWPEHHPVAPVNVRPGIRVQMSPALDDSPYVAGVLLKRVRRLSRKPAEEAVVLVAHGPETEEDNRAWLSEMESLGLFVKEKGRYPVLELATLQDDAPGEIRNAATQKLREQVRILSASYRVIIIPLLISKGGIEKKIAERLAGLDYVFSGETLLPSPEIALWLKERVKAGFLGW